MQPCAVNDAANEAAPATLLACRRAEARPTTWSSWARGGHGLATAYYLAKNHGITDVCVVEKGWLGGGNMARNTTIIRSNYLWDESAAIYEHSLKLWEGLEEDLGFDLQFSQRGVLNLAHDLGDVRVEPAARQREPPERRRRRMARRRRRSAAFCPIVNVSPGRAVPGAGRDAAAARRRRAARQGGVGRSRAAPTAWASTSSSTPRSPGSCAARTARSTGVRDVARRRSARTRWRWRRPATRSVLASMVGLRLPLQSHPLQALVSALLRAGAGLRRDVERRARLREPGGQGRAGDGRGHRRVQLLRAARVVPRDRAPDGRGARAVPDVRARDGAADVGRASSTCAPTRRRSSA